MGGRTRLWTVVRTAEPNNVDALVGLGLAGWRSGDIDAVRAYFSTVLELAPEHPMAIEYLERIAVADAAWMPLPEGLSTSGPERGVARSERSVVRLTHPHGPR